MSERTKVGIFGVGQIGKGHVKRYSKIDDAEIVAVADIDEAEAKRVAETAGARRVFTDFRELLKIDEIRAVDVCLHNNLHAPVTIASMEAGKHVYCEKPMAGSYLDARNMHDAAKRLRRKLGIQLGTLFKMETKAAKRLIDAGHLGRIYYAKSYGFRRRGRPYVDGYGAPVYVWGKGVHAPAFKAALAAARVSARGRKSGIGAEQ